MATSTIPTRYDIRVDDWREGVVPPPEGHVFGATALTQQEWRRLHQRPGRFVTVVRGGPGRLASRPKPFIEAAGDFRHAIENAGGATYAPHAAARLSVMTEAEWQRIERQVQR